MARSLRVPSYRLHKPSGQAVVTLSDKDHYLGPHGSPESRAAYERLIAEWLASGRSPVQPAPGLTVQEVLAAYWEHAEGYYRKNGEPTKQLDHVKRALAPARRLYGGTPAAEFGPAKLKACRQEMVRKGWCRRLTNQRVGCLKRAFKWAVAEELVPPSVHHGLQAVEGLKRGRTEAPESEPVPPAPEAAVAAVRPLLTSALRLVVDFQLLTACRPGEALSLRPCDIDRTRDVWVYRPATHKTEHHGRDRLVLVGPKAQALLAPLLEGRAAEAYVFSPKDSVADFRAGQRTARRSKVQPSQRDRAKARPKRKPGERYLPESYSHAVRLACKKAEVESWHPNQLRHNAATRLVEEFGWDTARIVLGHSSINTTRVYAEDDLRRAMEAVRKAG